VAESIAVVTGGTKGLGRAVSLALAARGYRVVALYLSDGQAAHDLDVLARATNASISCRRCDLTREEPVITEAGQAVERLVVVHSAAVPFVPAPIHLTGNDEVIRHWEVAVKGLLACVRPLLRVLSATAGSTVVGISSRAAVGGAAPTPGFAGYAAAKAAMTMLIGGLAREYGKRGLRTFCFAPGFMPTDLTAAWPDALRERAAASGQTTPELAAARIVGLIHDPSIPAAGETYE
jgi:NAD(P)-dependent dehydrogenase (short-subunit alcohol dehydrogenase family)